MPDFDDDIWLLLVNPISGGVRGQTRIVVPPAWTAQALQ
ncbi:hypothetical protein GALL_213570 [mine drainage metagenome]|uniref:Uncharacterized protein n=1 Tax=mine drainage metagenome TaxID=410659 RepID=A0A1J5RKU3_9ZZZZ